MIRLRRVVVQYYIALQLSAGAAVLSWPLDSRPDRPAIVRQARMAGRSGFDLREVVEQRGRLAVVTLPATGRDTGEFRIHPN